MIAWIPCPLRHDQRFANQRYVTISEASEQAHDLLGLTIHQLH